MSELKLPEEELPVEDFLEDAGVPRTISKAIHNYFNPDKTKEASYNSLSAKGVKDIEDVYPPDYSAGDVKDELEEQEGEPIYNLCISDGDQEVSLSFECVSDRENIKFGLNYHEGEVAIPLNYDKEEIEALEESELSKKFEKGYGVSGFGLPVAFSEDSKEKEIYRIDEDNEKEEKIFDRFRYCCYMESLGRIFPGFFGVLVGSDSYDDFLKRRAGSSERKQKEFEDWFAKNLFHYLNLGFPVLDESLEKINENKTKKNNNVYKDSLDIVARLLKGFNIYVGNSNRSDNSKTEFPLFNASRAVNKIYSTAFVADERNKFSDLKEKFTDDFDMGNKAVLRDLIGGIPEERLRKIDESDLDEISAFITRTKRYDNEDNKDKSFREDIRGYLRPLASEDAFSELKNIISG